MNAVDVSLLCKALGDANRLQIVQLLTQGGNVCLQAAGVFSNHPAYLISSYEGVD